MTIHFLLPFFRPQKCGVSDHSSVLAKHINQLFGESSRLLTVFDHEPAPHDTFIDCRSLDSLKNRYWFSYRYTVTRNAQCR
jgi:hypothetical protein